MKKVIVRLLVIAILGVGWFLFFKPGDFTAKIKANANLGTIEQSIKRWKEEVPTTTTFQENDDLIVIEQQLTAHDSTHVYQWNIKRISDSLAEITVHIKDPQHSINNRIQGVWKETDFKKQSKKTVLDFNKILQEHIETIKITIDGEVSLQESHYAYTENAGPQTLKANGMMRDITHLQNTMVRSNIELDGPPFVKITYWNRATDSINYQFGFPIIPTKNLPDAVGIKYGFRPEQKALKATYNGNYATSDRAWYALIDYANKHDISINPKAIEVFHNNPTMGGDATKWKAEIYMPILD